MTESDLSLLKTVKDKYQKKLLSLPNVVAVGIGSKIREGQETGQMAIKVFVRRKVSKKSLTIEETIPGELDGFPTDVVMLDPLKAQ